MPEIAFAGENPLIMLYRPGAEDLIAVASLWHARYTAWGSGHSLLLWTDPEATGLGPAAPTGIYTDNLPLANGLWERFNRRWEPLVGHGIEQSDPRPARFAHLSDASGDHRVSCRLGTSEIELRWHRPRPAIWTETYPYEYRTTAVILPCESATISVDGRPAVGEIRDHDDVFARSACLAFCETWMTRDDLPADGPVPRV